MFYLYLEIEVVKINVCILGFRKKFKVVIFVVYAGTNYLFWKR